MPPASLPSTQACSQADLALIDTHWRAANYLSSGIRRTVAAMQAAGPVTSYAGRSLLGMASAGRPRC
jgi:hypothetical protein